MSLNLIKNNFSRINILYYEFENFIKFIFLAKLGILFIYISTDYVFDGKNPPYKTDAQTNPLNKYGMSKLSGEVVTSAASKSIYSAY